MDIKSELQIVSNQFMETTDTISFDTSKLLPELRASIVEYDGRLPFFRHPLLVGYALSPEEANRRLQSKQRALDKALKAKDFFAAIFLHERQFRFDFLSELVAQGSLTTEQLRELLTEVWQDCEFPHSLPRRRLLSLFASTGYISDDPEKPQSPDRLTIFRGCLVGYARQLSWTTDRDRARWFAKRFRYGGGAVYQAEILKRGILAWFIGRQESEMVVNPKRLRDIVVLEAVEPPK